MSIYVTSDQHFSHAGIIELCSRPFSNVDEMDEALIANWNSVVKPNDVTYVMGDLVMFPHAKKRTHEAFDERDQETIRRIALCSRLNGTKFLIRGNHDPIHPMYHTQHQALYGSYKSRLWAQVWQEVGGVTVLDEQHLLDNHILMCHFPWSDSMVDDRMPEWHPRREDYPKVELLLHGHVHGYANDRDHGWRFKSNMINVGVDVWDYRPVAIDTLLDEYNSLEESQ